MTGRARRWLGALLHIDDSPERTAAACALGVFFGFSPMIGLHTVFGRVTSGMDVVNTIGTIDTDMQDRPLSEVRIESVTVGDAG